MTRSAPAFAIVILSLLTGIATAQTPQIPPEGLPPPVEAKTPVASASEQLVHLVSQSVASLDASGTRTLDAIANSDVTLTLGDLTDSSIFAVLCINGGEHLRSFTQSLAQELELSGKVLHPYCTGVGHGSDPFVLTFHLHYEGGRNGLFNEDPLLLPACLEQVEEQAPEHFGEQPPDRAPEQVPERVQDLEPEDAPPARGQDAPDATSSDPQPIPLCSQHTQTSHAIMSLPQGWKPEDLPKPTHSDSAFATFDLTQTFDNGTLVTDQKLVIKKDKIELIDLPAYQKWRESAEIGNYTPPIGLQSTLYFPNSAFTGKTDDEKKAATLMSEAGSDIEFKNFSPAEAKLKQAEALDPGHERLHDEKGDLAAARGDKETAVVEYQKELQAFPDVLIEMETIANTQRDMGNTDDAIATLERWISADPNSPFAAIDLMYLYHQMGRDDLAAAVGDRAMDTFTKDAKQSVRFLLLYGRELLLVGREQDADATLEALLDLTTDSGLVNDAAYYLSVHGLSLARDEQIVRDALLHFEPGTDGTVAYLNQMSPDQKSSLLFATWDTLGWILFREGKLKEAESYIRAAWRGHQDPAIGHHLGDLLVAQEKPGEALDVYQMALAMLSPKSEEKAEQDTDAGAMRAAVDRLQKLGAKASIKDPTLAITQLRTLPAGPAGKLRGEWQYHLALAATKEIVVDLEDPKGAAGADLIRAIKLPVDFFPTDSKAGLYVEAKLTCTTTCSLFFPPQQ